MIRPQVFLGDRQGLGGKALGFRIVFAGAVERRQGAQTIGYIRMARPEGLPPDVYRAMAAEFERAYPAANRCDAGG